MAVLLAEPTGWASWNVRISSAEQDLTELKISTWRSRGSFRFDGQDFTIEPTGFWLQNAVLQRGGTVVARAERPGLVRRRWVISSAGHRMELVSRSWTGKEYALRLGNRDVGSITRKGFSGRRVSLDFPDEVPGVLQVFLTYLVVSQAKREMAVAASAGG